MVSNFVLIGFNTLFERQMEKKRIPRSLECARIRPGYERILSFSDSTDRRNHQSGAFDRALISSGWTQSAFIGASEDLPPSMTERFLADLVIWWDRISGKPDLRGIMAFIPVSWSRKILNMLSFLRIPLRCYEYESSTARVREIFPDFQGNPDLSSPYIIYPGFAPPGILRELKTRFPELDLIYRRNRWELSHFGLPVIWIEHSGDCWFDFGMPRLVRNYPAECASHVRAVLELRAGTSGDRRSYSYMFGPERWLESMLVRDLSLVRPGLGRHFYCQVPSRLDDEKKVVDILAVDGNGILVVLEVKAECRIEDIFQGLGYRSRVSRHLGAGDFQKMGYFRQVKLAEAVPVLGFISPLFAFHRSLPVIWKYIKPGGEVFFTGINSDWRKGIRPLRRFNLEQGRKNFEKFPYS